MDENNKSNKIEELKMTIINIISEINDLKSGNNSYYSQISNQIKETNQKKLKELRSWSENKREFANKNYESEMSFIEDDFQTNKEISYSKCLKFLRYKYDKLSQSVPEFSRYFNNRNIPFISQISHIEPLKIMNYSSTIVDVSKECALDEIDVNNDIEFLNAQCKYEIKNRTLFKEGLDTHIGAKVSVIISEQITINGNLDGVGTDQIMISPTEGPPFNISLKMLNTGAVSLMFDETE